MYLLLFFLNLLFYQNRVGLRPGDVIIKVNDEPVKNSSEIFEILKKTPHLHLTIIRNYKEINVILNAEEL